MRRILWIAIAALVVTAITSSTAPAQYGGGGGMGSSNKKILSFSSMYGVNGPFVGANPIRGVVGDGLPWIVKSAKGTLTSRGKLTISVKGLVFPAVVGVPPELQGINDEPEFRAIVSCLAVNGTAVEETNVITQGFPANTKGNAKIKAQVTLPQPCVAPIVFIVGADEELWFASTGY